MSLLVKVGSFAKSTGGAPASQAVTGVGFQPKALILFAGGPTAFGAWTGSERSFVGFSGGATDSQSIGLVAGDALNPTNTSRRIASKIAQFIGGAETLQAEADLTSFDSDGFTLNWTTNDANARLISYIALGGPDALSVKTIPWTLNTTTGNKAVTGAGFQPTCLIHLHVGNVTAALPAAAASAVLGLGVTDQSGNQWALTGLSSDNVATTDTQRFQRTDCSILNITTGLGTSFKASHVSFDADGFTTNLSTASGSAARIVTLCLAGPVSFAGSFAKSTGAAPTAQSVTGVGFSPAGLLLAGDQDIAETTPQAEMRAGIGATDGSAQQSIAIIDQDAASPSVAKSRAENSTLYVKADNSTPAIDAYATIDSLDPNGWSQTWDTNDAVATVIQYLAFGGGLIRAAAAALALSGAAPVLSAGSIPSAGALTLTGAAPTVVVGGGVSITPSAGSLTLAGSVPDVKGAINRIPAAGALTLTGVSPALSAGLTPSAGALTLSGSAPGVQQVVSRTPVAGALILTGAAATLVVSGAVIPSAGALTLTGSAPGVAQHLSITPSTGALTLSASVPGVSQGLSLIPSPGALTLSGSAPGVQQVVSRTPVAGALTLTGSAPGVSQGVSITPSPGALTLTGSTPGVAQAVSIAPPAGALTLAGTAPTVTVSGAASITPSAGALTLSGAAPGVAQNLSIAPTAGALTLTGSAPTVTRVPPPSPADRPWELRLYGSDGLRKRLPAGWITEVTFELLERGGYGAGSFMALATWEQLQLAGTERVDVYVWGQLAYRGFVRVNQNDVAATETCSPTLYGLMEKLNGYQVRCRYSYSVPTDVATICSDVLNDHVKITNRLPNLVIETTPTGVKLQQFDAVGHSVTDALNELADHAPNAVVWGIDANAVYQDRLYFKPRPTTTGYRFTVGGAADGERKVEAFIYPRDNSAIVNRLYIRGGAVAQPNLVPNGSFERPLPYSETLGNQLANYSFEDATAWTWLAGASRLSSPGAPRTGTFFTRLDALNEEVRQTIPIDYKTVYTVSVWARQQFTGVPGEISVFVEGLDASNNLIATNGLITAWAPTSVSYERMTLTLDFGGYSNVTQMRVRIVAQNGSAGTIGVLVDDIAVFETAGVANSGWTYALAGAAKRVSIDWRSKIIAAYHGCYSVRAEASGVTLSTDYLELHVTQDSRVQVKSGEVYTMTVARQTGLEGSASMTFGVRQYNQAGTLLATSESSTITGDLGVWGLEVLTFTTNAATATVEPFVRLRSNSAEYFDGVMLMEGSIPQEIWNNAGWWEGDSYEREIDVTDANLTGLSVAAAASITSYGEREREEGAEGVVDYDTALAYAKGYFNAHAVPAVEAQLRVMGVPELVRQDGLIKLVNLPGGPNALWPARIRYVIGDEMRMDVDLGNARADLTELVLRRQERGL